MLGVVTEITLRLLPASAGTRDFITAAFAHSSAGCRSCAGDFCGGIFYRRHLKFADHFTPSGAARFVARRSCQRETRICSSIWMGNKRASAARPRLFAN